jgi:hypothetical protein
MVLPDSAGLKICRGARENSSRNGFAGLAAIHNTLGDWGEGPASMSAVVDFSLREEWSIRGPVIGGDIVIGLVRQTLASGLLLKKGRLSFSRGLDFVGLGRGRLVAAGHWRIYTARGNACSCTSSLGANCPLEERHGGDWKVVDAGVDAEGDGVEMAVQLGEWCQGPVM